MKAKKSFNPITTLLANIFTGFMWIFIKISISIYRFIKYVWYGLLWPFVFIILIINKAIVRSREVDVEKLRQKGQKILEKEKLKESKNNKKDKNITIDTSSYKNKNIKLERKNLGYYINLVLNYIISIPKNIKKRFDNIAVVKQAKNKKAFDTKTMLVDFSTDDINDENKGKRITWEYIAINQNGKRIKGYFEAFSRVDVQSFLMGEGLAVYSIRTSKLIQLLHGNLGGNNTRIKNRDLIYKIWYSTC